MSKIVRANAIKALQTLGYSEAQAIAVVDRNGNGGRSHGETVVPGPGGDGIRPAGPQGNLFAAVSASPVIQYDQRAIAAIWEGLIDALRTGGTVDAAELFPDAMCGAPTHSARYAQERAMGAQMVSVMPIAIKALGVTVPEWSAWYARSAAVVLRPHPNGCGCGCGTGMGNGASNGGQPQAAVSNWGSPFGAPLLNPGT